MADDGSQGFTQLVLASGSPRRSDLLRLLGLRFKVVVADIDESERAGETPVELVERLAVGKAAVVAAQHPGIVLGADTVVSVDGEILGKPGGPAPTEKMLTRLSDRWHLVTSGVCVIGADGVSHVGVAETEVLMAPITCDEIAWYVATGEPFDKAGGYAIQGAGGVFVKRIRGNMHNVVGLPLDTACRLLRLAGLDPLTTGPR